MFVFPGALFKGKPQGFRWFCCHQEEIEPLSILHELVVHSPLKETRGNVNGKAGCHF